MEQSNDYTLPDMFKDLREKGSIVYQQMNSPINLRLEAFKLATIVRQGSSGFYTADDLIANAEKIYQSLIK